MKNYQLNQTVSEFDFSVLIPVNKLIQKGWEFNMAEKEAKQYAAEIRIDGKKENKLPYTSVRLDKWSDLANRVTFGVREDTGDDEATINDIIALLNEGVITEAEIERNDNSVNENETYVHTFIKIT